MTIKCNNAKAYVSTDFGSLQIEFLHVGDINDAQRIAHQMAHAMMSAIGLGNYALISISSHPNCVAQDSNQLANWHQYRG